MGVFQNNLMGAAAAAGSAAAGGFYTHQIANSVRTFESTNSKITRTPSSAGNMATWSISIWMKRSKLGASQFIFEAGASGGYASRLFYSFVAGGGIEMSSGEVNYGTTTELFRDVGAWYHIFIKNASNSNTLYVNGTLIKTTTLSGDTAVNSAVAHGLGCRYGGGTTSYEGYIAEFLLFDGTAYDPTDVAETKNGVWIPKDPSGLTLSGTNTTWLKFEASGDLGNDSSGNNNDWTIGSDISAHDQMTDSPTFNSDSNGGNFATLNPLNTRGGTAVATQLTEGNLMWTPAATQDESSGTMSIGAGGVDKVYMEVYCVNNSDTGWFGVWEPKDGSLMSAVVSSTASSVRFKPRTGQKVTAGTVSNYIGDGSEVDPSGVIFQMAVDVPAGKIWWGKNNAWGSDGADHIDDDNVAFTTLNTDGTFLLFTHTGGASVAQPDWVFNFGQDGTFAGNKTAGGNADDTGYGNFFYAPPTGFLAVCSGNISTAAAVDPAQTDDDYPQKLFAPKLYTGDAAATLTISGMDFQPDLTWIKNRDATDRHCLFDSTRGVTKLLSSDSGDAQTTDADTLKSWTSDGYTVGADVKVNTSGEDYASWNWRANGGTTASNGNGDLTSTVQADPSGCFSIVTYTGTLSSAGVETVGHGLDSAPSLIIFKGVGLVANWWVFSDSLTSWNHGMNLNTTSALFDKSGNGSMSAPTATVFSTNYTDGLNDTEGDIAYCFANCEGYIKSGTYVGNGNDNGTFVYTGFRPAFIILKEKIVDSWLLYDDKRFGINTDAAGGNSSFNPDANYAEAGGGGGRALDILSNGFKLRTSNATGNASGGNYLYLAIAHNPFQYATAR